MMLAGREVARSTTRFVVVQDDPARAVTSSPHFNPGYVTCAITTMSIPGEAGFVGMKFTDSSTHHQER
jgi:hypothetical protein